MDEDTRLEAELRLAAALFDPPPASLAGTAEAAFAFRSLDAELAVLTFDSLTTAGTVRSADEARLLTFTAGPVTIDVEVVRRGSAEPNLIGQVDPTGPVHIDVRAADRTVTVTTDDLGRFTSGPLGHGPYSLRLHSDPHIVTEWFTTR